MDAEKLDEIKDEIRKELQEVDGAVVDDTSVQRELVLGLLNELGVVDKSNYKPQKRYLP